MMSEAKSKFLEALDKKAPYMHLAMSYPEMSKETIKDICLEMFLALYQMDNQTGKSDSADILEAVKDGLTRRWQMYDE